MKKYLNSKSSKHDEVRRLKRENPQLWDSAFLFIGEFGIYRVFAQMKQNLNFDAFYLIKHPDQHPKLITDGES
jgi:hypothetical protein